MIAYITPFYLLQSLGNTILLDRGACLHAQSLSCVWLFVTPWTVAHQAPLSKGFSRQESWSGLPFPSPGESSWPRDRTQVSCIAGSLPSEPPGAPKTLERMLFIFLLNYLREKWANKNRECTAETSYPNKLGRPAGQHCTYSKQYCIAHLKISWG